MINPDIVSYIRTELQKGTDRQTITNSLISNGWNTQDIAEGFSALNASVVPSPMAPSQNNINITMEKPSSVKRFEFLMYAALLISLGSSLVKYSGSLSYGLNTGILLLIPLAWAIFPFILVWLAARHRKDWARWVLVVLMGIGIVSIVPALLFGFSSATSLLGSAGLETIGLTLIQTVLEIIAFCYVFSSASNRWFSSGMSQMTVTADPSVPIVNHIWKRDILFTNIGFLIAYLVLVFGVDLSIITQSPDLTSFWQIMLVVLAAYLVFFLLETFVFRKKFATSASGSDSGIVTVIVLRNILFLLNFIPFIQLLGLAGLPTVGLILLVIYIILIVRRFNSSKAVLQA